MLRGQVASFSADEIRIALRESLRAHDPAAALFNEMPLCRGIGRADLASVNGSLSGFEIKSARDSLARLPLQIKTYEEVFDFNSVVVTHRHFLSVRKSVPRKWGVYLIESRDDSPTVLEARRPKNNRPSIEAQIRLLWKPEVIKALRRLGSSLSPSSPVMLLWGELERLPQEAVAKEIRDLLKAREWQESVVP